MDPVGGGKMQRIAELHAERRVPGVEVPDNSVAPVERQRVGIGKQARAGRSLAQLRLLSLRIGEEEPLIAGQPADHQCLTVNCLILLVGRIRRLDIAKVRESNRLRLITAYSQPSATH
jgi:hypothetical protein